MEKSLHPTTPMPVVHISLECATPTAHADGAFRTLVAVTDAELREGAHLREAARRASIVGFGGPHRLVTATRLDAATPEEATHFAALNVRWVGRSMNARLDSLLTPEIAGEGNLPEPDKDDHLTPKRHDSSKRVGVRTQGSGTLR